MDLTDLSLHTYRALKDCPGGQRAGTIFQETEAIGDVLIAVGDVELVADEKPSKGYNRRDMKAKA